MDKQYHWKNPDDLDIDKNEKEEHSPEIGCWGIVGTFGIITTTITGIVVQETTISATVKDTILKGGVYLQERMMYA